MRQVESMYPLTPTQEGMLFHSLAAPGQALYVEVTTLRWLGALDLDRFRAAWDRAVAKHAALRTAFVYEGLSSPHQVVLAQADLPVEFRDLTAFDDAEQARIAAEEVQARYGQGFDLIRPPLMRILVLAQSDGFLIVWIYHHLILDGWSSALLIHEIVSDLLGKGRGSVPPRPFGDYVGWLRQRNQAADLVFWRGYLAGYREAAVMTLAGTRTGASSSGRFRKVEQAVPRATVAELKRLASRAATTLSGIMEACWAGIVSCYAGRDDVVIGLTVSGRPARVRAA